MNELLNILRGVHRSYENRYGIELPDASLKKARDLTQRYRNGWKVGTAGRALILLDRSIAQFSVEMNSRAPNWRRWNARARQSALNFSRCRPMTSAVLATDVERRQQLDQRLVISRHRSHNCDHNGPHRRRQSASCSGKIRTRQEAKWLYRSAASSYGVAR